MKVRDLKKLLAASLAAAVCFTGLNFSPLLQAREVKAAELQQEELLEETKVELPEERTEDTTTFQLQDGTKELVLYSDAVRFENEKGELVDYDATLTEVTDQKSEQDNRLEGYAYENTEGDKKNYIPEELDTETPLLLEYEGKSIAIAPAVEEEENAFGMADAFEAADEIVETVSDLYENESSETTGTSYVTADDKIELQYISSKDGVKENIVLYEMPQSNIFQYVLDLHGLVPVMNELTGNVDLYEQDAEEPSAYIEAPYMNDASEDNYSEEAHYDIRETEDGQYMLTLTVDEEYLAGAQYPVTIDPTTTWRSDPWIKDAYVIKGSTYGDINFYDSGNTAMSVGKATQGQTRTYLRLDKLAATLQGNCVVSGKLYLYENGSYATSNNIQIRRVTESFKLSTVTWNTQPSYGETIATVTTNGTSGHELVADVTEHLRKLAVGTYTNYGLMLRNADETNSKYTKLYGTRHATTSKTPKMVVKYVDGPTTATEVTITPKYAKKNSQITLSWDGITTSYLDYVQYRVADSSGTTIVKYSGDTKLATTSSGSKTITTGSWADGTYKYYVRGVDKGGIAGTGKGASIIIDNTAPVIKTLTASAGTTSKITPSDVVVTWGITEANLASVQYQINKGEFKPLAKSLSGTIKILKSTFTSSGTYTVTLVVKDAVGLSATKSVPIYIDADAPVMQSVTVSPNTGESNPSKDTSPTISWSVKACGDVSKVEYSLDGGTYKTAGSAENGSYTLPDKSVVTAGKHTIAVRAIDKAGNVGTPKSAVYWLDDISINMDDYAITNVSQTQNYGKNLIRWETKTELPAKMDIRIYRSETKGFTPAAGDIVYEGSGKTYWMDMDNTGKAYYYRVSVVRKNTKGTVIEEKLFADEVSGTGQLVEPSTVSRTGNMFWGSYFTYDTPTGNGSVEKSSGNHMYTQEDFSLSNSQLSYGLGRTYNSNLDISGMLGTGWTDSWHMELYKGNGKMFLLRSDGSVYTFEETAEEEEYQCVESASYSLKVNADGFELDLGTGQICRFNMFGQMMGKEEPNGNTVAFRYDTSGRLEAVISNQGTEERTLQLAYVTEDPDRLSSLTLPDGTVMEYTYENGHLVKAEHRSADGASSVAYEYGYDTAGLLSVVRDAKGQEYSIRYNDSRADKVVYPNEESYVLDYGSGTTSVSKYDNGNRKIYSESVTWDPATGKLLVQTDTLGNETAYKYTFDSNPLLSTGTETEVEYGELLDGKIIPKTKTVTTDTAYNDREDVIQSSDEAGNTTSYQRDGEGNLTSEKTISESGEVLSNSTFSYDENNNLLGEEDLVGGTESSYVYDAAGNVTNETEIQEDVLESYSADYEYDADGNKVNEQVTNGNIHSETESEYDAMGRVIRQVSSDGIVTEYTYDFMGRCTSEKVTWQTDGYSETSRRSYDANGTLVSETMGDGTTISYTYDSINRLIQRVQTREESVTYGTSYGVEENIRIQDGMGGYICPVAYVQTETKNGQVVSSTFTDGNGRTIRKIDDGIYTDYTYDKNGQQIAVKTYGQDTEGLLSAMAYDAEGNCTETIENPVISDGYYAVGEDSIQTSQVYDASGNLTESVDANGVTTSYTYDDSQRVTSVTENSGSSDAITSTVTYQTTEDGVITTCVDANGNRGIETTDASGLTTMTEDVGTDGTKLSVSYEYDSDGNMTRQSYGDGSYLTFLYDGKKQLLRKEAYQSDGVLESKTEYEYDRKGNLMSEVDSIASEDGQAVPYLYTCYAYDAYGRQTGYGEFAQETVPTESEKAASMILYSYDGEDNIQEIQYPSGIESGVDSLIYHYNAAHTRLESIGIVISGQEKTLRSYEYDPLGRVTGIRTFTDDTEGYVDICYQYDLYGRIQKMSYNDAEGAEKEAHIYTYDRDSNILSETETNTYSSDVTQQINRCRDYTYDAFGQLVKSVETDYNDNNKKSTTRYTYDRAGNRLAKEEDGTVTSYTYNGLDQLLSSTTVKDGQTTSEMSYRYDKKGNQLEETDRVSGTQRESSYSVSGYLTKQTIKNQDTTILVQENTYNGDGERICKSENGTLTRYIHEAGGVLYTLDGQNSLQSFNLYGESGNIISTIRKEEDTENFYFYNKDIKGSTTTLLDEDDVSAGIYDYSDFGETGEIQQAVITNEICYTGAFYDESTGLYYLNARYYDPVTGRFLSQDTYRGEDSDPGSWWLYAYCVNNPIGYTDPSGHFIETAVDIASIAFSAYELQTNPSWINLGFLAWDVASVFIPFVPGSYSVKAVKVVKTVKRGKKLKKITEVNNLKYFRIPSKISELKNAQNVLVGSYSMAKSMVKKMKAVSKVEVHHLIEKRFLQTKKFKVNEKFVKAKDMMSVPLSKELHKEITRRWREVHKYGKPYGKLDKSTMKYYIGEVYKDMPALKEYALKYLNDTWVD